MGNSFTPELIRLLREVGCCFERSGKGDHDIWFSPLTHTRFPVDNKIKSRHTANAVLRQAGCRSIFKVACRVEDTQDLDIG